MLLLFFSSSSESSSSEDCFSSSASEIVAGALKDHKSTIPLGEYTYGKGSRLPIIPLSDGGGMRLTISKYYLPSGQSISEVGISPDILVEEESEDFKIKFKLFGRTYSRKYWSTYKVGFHYVER